MSFASWLTFGAFGPSTANKYSNFFIFERYFSSICFDEQDIHFHHHVHRLEQILRKVTLFKEERVEAVVHIVLYVVQWTYFGEDAWLSVRGCSGFLPTDRHGTSCPSAGSGIRGRRSRAGCIFTMSRNSIFSSFRRITDEPVNTIFRLGSGRSTYAVPPPFRVLEYLVYQQHFSSAALEFGGELHDTMSGEVEVVHVDEEAGAVCAEFLFGILQQESSLTYASCAFDTDKTVIPVYFVH